MLHPAVHLISEFRKLTLKRVINHVLKKLPDNEDEEDYINIYNKN